MSVGTAGFWICAWAVTFTLPYLFDADQANLGPMVGWIYAGGGLISVVSIGFRLSWAVSAFRRFFSRNFATDAVSSSCSFTSVSLNRLDAVSRKCRS